MRQLHKCHRDYTDEEILEIKTKHCKGCEHLKVLGSASSASYAGSKDKEHIRDRKYGYWYCDFLHDTGSRRICAAELCPYGKKEGGVKLNEETHEKFVDFTEYCPRCKHKDCKETDEPCNECLEYPTNYESMKPVKWEKNED